MELTLNILGLLVCFALTFAVLRAGAIYGRSYVACFAIILVCVALIFPAISMTDDLAMGIVMANDTGMPQLKFWVFAVLYVLITAIFVAVTLLALPAFRIKVALDSVLRPICPGYHSANSLRAPPAVLA